METGAARAQLDAFRVGLSYSFIAPPTVAKSNSTRTSASTTAPLVVFHQGLPVLVVQLSHILAGIRRGPTFGSQLYAKRRATRGERAGEMN